eukprot:UN00626
MSVSRTSVKHFIENIKLLIELIKFLPKLTLRSKIGL